MTDEEFEKRVVELMASERISEEEARLKVGVEAGLGGDVEGSAYGADPVKSIEDLGDTWKPKEPKK